MRSSFTPSLLIIFTLFISTLSTQPDHTTLQTCRSQCGTIPINYPFGVDNGCGAPQYRQMLNCSVDSLFFLTPSGSYKVKSIDYQKQTMSIFDPSMSTCTILQPHHDFVMSDIQSVIIPPTSDTIFALLNCSIDSPLLNHYRSLCFNFSGHSCDELYSCTSFSIFHSGPVGLIGPNVTAAPGLSTGRGGGPGGNPPCCFTDYGTVKLMNMNILDCSHYTSVYDTDALKGVGPLDWAYGIKMGYSLPNAGCERCQKSGGTCGYDAETEMTLCMCSSISNSTRECPQQLRDVSCMANCQQNQTSGSGGSVADGGGNEMTTPTTLFLSLVLTFHAYIIGNL